MQEDIQNILEFYQTNFHIFRIVIYAIIFVFLFQQLFLMTSFAWNYNYYTDYGNMLKNMCKDAYTEAETGRFQVAENSMCIRIANDSYGEANLYNSVIFIVIIIFMGFTTFMFLYIFLYITMGIEVTKIPIYDFEKAITYLKGNTNLDWLSSENMKVLWRISCLLLTIYIFTIPILYVVLKLANVWDISPFQVDFQMFHLIPIALICFALVKAVKKKYIKPYNWIFACILLILIIYFCVSAYILTLGCQLYTSSVYSDVSKKQYYDTNDDNPYTQWFKRIFDFNTNRGETYKNILIVILIVFGGLFAFTGIAYLIVANMLKTPDTAKDMRKLISLIALLPTAVLFIVIFLAKAHLEFNTMINKFILFQPELLYKKLIYKINLIFNKILENDKVNVLDRSVCQNYANAIHMAVYSDIFGNYGKTPLFVPELKYLPFCDNAVHVDYTIQKRYNIDFYINENQNVFFTTSNMCSSVNNELLYNVMSNCLHPNDDTIKNSIQVKMLNAIAYVDKGKIYDGSGKSIDYSNEYVANNTIKNIFLQSGGPPKPEKHIENIVTKIAEFYEKYMLEMNLETIKTVRAICNCNGLPDVTQEKSITTFKNQFKDYILDKSGGSYSLSLKKDYINVFVKHTSEFFNSANNILTSAPVPNTSNYKLTKLIIKHYNRMQNSDEAKYFNKILSSEIVTIDKDDQNNVYTNPFYHIEKIENITSNILQTSKDTTKLSEFNTQVQKFKDQYEQEYKENTFTTILFKYKDDYLRENSNILNTDPIVQTKYSTNINSYLTNFGNFKNMMESKFKDKLITDYSKIQEDFEKDAKRYSENAKNTANIAYIMLTYYIIILIIISLVVMYSTK